MTTTMTTRSSGDGSNSSKVTAISATCSYLSSNTATTSTVGQEQQQQRQQPVLHEGRIGNSNHDDDDGMKNHGETTKSSASVLQQQLPSNEHNANIPSISATAVLGESASMPAGSIPCRGFDFNEYYKLTLQHDEQRQQVAQQQQERKQRKDEQTGDEDDDDKKAIEGETPNTSVVRHGQTTSPSSSFSPSLLMDELLSSYLTTGFQATNLGLAVEQVRRMRAWRMSDAPWKEGEDDEELRDVTGVRRRLRARIFLAFTSNQVSCGQREVLRFLVQHKMVDVLITTAGGIEEDVIKCLRDTYVGSFKLPGAQLRRRGINRIGNLLVPNHNYCVFEDWFAPLLDKMHDEQDEAAREWARSVAEIADAASAANAANGAAKSTTRSDDEFPRQDYLWTPSKFVRRLGREINHEDSILYWAARNDIPVFCPALTDGSLGDMIYFHSYNRPGFVVDIAADIRGLNDLAVRSHCTGQIILGGGLVKHHTCNANLMRNGADYSVYINSASEFDGSDAGASPDEAVSWGKIRAAAEPVKVCADATLAFPLLVSQTFARNVDEWKRSVENTACWIDDLKKPQQQVHNNEKKNNRHH